MSNQKDHHIPDVSKTFFYGNVVFGRSMGDVVYIKSRKNYSFRLFLIFESGDTKIVQRSGYPDKLLTRQKRDETLMQISKGTFVPFSYSVKEFFDYWLYYHMIQEKHITYNTFTMYRNIIRNYINPFIGTKWLDKLKREDLVKTLHKISSKDLQRTAIGVITGSLRYAQSRNYIPCYIYEGLSAELKRKGSSTLTIKRKSPVYTIEQITRLLCLCKEKEPQLYLPMLLAATAGLRVSEIIALRYEDIDFLNNKLSVERQLGRSIYPDESSSSRPVLSQELKLKTKRSKRSVDLADFVLEEIFLERQRYEEHRAKDPSFLDLGYLCCRENGQCYNRKFYTKAYNRLTEQCDFPRLPWRKFRNSYATILAGYKINMKTISECLGHYSPDFTNRVYVATKNLSAYDISEAIEEYVSANHLLPEDHSPKVLFLPEDLTYKKFFFG